MVSLLWLVQSQWQSVPWGCGMVCDSVAPGMCAPCGLLSLVSPTMCFILCSCGMMDFYDWLPYVFHRIAVLGFTSTAGFQRHLVEDLYTTIVCR